MKVWAVLAALALGCAACGGGDDQPVPGAHADVRICMYDHGNSGSYWSTVKRGAQQAAADLGVTLDYQEANDDVEAEAHLIEDGVAAHCDGLAISAPDPGGLQQAADQAQSAGIPVVVMNAGQQAIGRLHAFTFVGQDDALAGSDAATRLAATGASSLLCVEQEGENPAIDRACAGAARSFPATHVLRLSQGVADLPLSQQELQARLAQDPGIDAVLSLDPAIAVGSVLPAVAASGRAVTVGTLGISPPAVKAVQDGRLAFAADDQPFVQGYLSVVLLYLAATTGAETGAGEPVYSGPDFVTKDDAARVLQLEAAGTR